MFVPALVVPALVTAALLAPTVAAPPAEIFGRVVDDAGAGIPGVTLELTGTAAADGESVSRRGVSDQDGWWKLGGLPAGRYALTEVQPSGYADGPETPGTAGGVAQQPDTIAGIELAPGQRAVGYEFSNVRTASRPS